jgi:hypothetical protein
MKLRFAFLLVACLLLTVRAEEEVDEKDVIVLTDKNFNDTVTKHKYALVRLMTFLTRFYAV